MGILIPERDVSRPLRQFPVALVMIIFPRDEIQTIVVGFFGVRQTRISALILIGFWFLTQLVSGVGSITDVEQGGVVYFAHVGGFGAGLLLIKPFGIGRSEDD